MSLVCALLILTAFWLGIGFGADTKATGYDESEDGTYWCEVYDDGTVVIHTMQKYVTNAGEDLVVKGESRNESYKKKDSA